MTLATSWRVRPFTETDGKAICTWSYPAPYSVYNWPSWEELSARAEEFADPGIREKQYAAITNERDELCGFAQFFPLTGVTRLGLGIRPDLCGQGLGPSYVECLVAEARRRNPGNEIDLEVLVRNERAIKAYIRAGFAVTDTYERMTPTGMAMMHCMVHGAEQA
ncbi:GNAT family N-acetyltransferase [Paenibacillus chitinolyticus]|uniref:GNAT family N-acetyltransferase n=1 Tax=Paenibacillus chitinolyticus TaxID=79263 RepID=UPI002DB71A16|nr:GNAT family N-acetyltransferase [Paenibacillus chitinolyticus]MEC0244933.1 GNAT family N-acetyltransferase [Paenibacillus chitinolyticus]